MKSLQNPPHTQRQLGKLTENDKNLGKGKEWDTFFDGGLPLGPKNSMKADLEPLWTVSSR